MATSPAPSSGADATVNVTMNVVSQTTLNLSGCSTAAMSFGPVLPGVPQTTPAACAITFGSSNNSSMLLVYQLDQDRAAMVQDADGTPDIGFKSGNKYVSSDTLAADATWMAHSPDGPSLTYVGGSAAAPSPDAENDRNIVVRAMRSDGSLHTWFGDGGTATIPISATNDDTSWAGVVQSDSKIVVAGSVDRFAGPQLDVAVVRLDVYGALDTSFGTGGVLTWDVGGVSQWARDIDILPDGSMLVTGISGAWDHAEQHSGFVAKVLANGTLDPNFGTNGTLMLEAAPTLYDAALGSQLLPSGKFIVTGDRTTGGGNIESFASMRNADGSLDTAWGNLGWFVPDWGDGSVDAKLGRADLDPITGEGFLVGHHGTPSVIDVTRMNANGTADTSWGTSGTVVIDEDPARSEVAYGALMLDRAHVMITGATFTSPPNSDWLVAQIGPDGLDPTFSDDGIDIIDNATKWDYGVALLRQRDGAIRIAGTMSDATNVAKFGVIQYSGGENIDNYYVDSGDDTQSNRFNANPQRGAFGGCLESASGTNLNNDGWMTAADGTCDPTDADPWSAVGRHPGDYHAKIMGKFDAGTASVAIRFGIKAPQNFSPGIVRAPLVFEVQAPDYPTPWFL